MASFVFSEKRMGSPAEVKVLVWISKTEHLFGLLGGSRAKKYALGSIITVVFFFISPYSFV